MKLKHTVTRIEGHATITVVIDDKTKEIKSVNLHITEFRGFEQFMVGRHINDAPIISTRICGVCPTAHHMCASKATDMYYRAEIPEPARKLRQLLNLGGMAESHALHFFVLGAPDLVFGIDAPMEKRNILAIKKEHPDLFKKGFLLVKTGLSIIETVGGRKIHPICSVPGGVIKPLSASERENLLNAVKESIPVAEEVVDFTIELMEKIDLSFGDLPTNYVALTRDGFVEHYDGRIRVLQKDGKKFEFDDIKYNDYIEETSVDYSYAKYPYLKQLGFPEGLYRVGPMARLVVNDKFDTPKSNEFLKEFKKFFEKHPHVPLLYHLARVIELLYCLEKSKELLESDDITSENTKVKLEKGYAGDAIGVVEAPRGLLIHHYKVDDDGIITWANLVVATVQNIPIMDKSLESIAKKYFGKASDDVLFNAMETLIRAYDPCISCATHASNPYSLQIIFVNCEGEIIKKIVR